MRQHFAKFRDKFERGDSLIEVLLAMTVLSIIAVGSIVVMNRGNSIIQSSLERTEVRAQINTQIELLQYIHDRNPVEWNKIIGYGASNDGNATKTPVDSNNKCATTTNSFYIATNTNLSFKGLNAPSKPAPTAAQLTSNSKDPGMKDPGIWIDAAYYPAGTGSGTSGAPQGYTDFYIKACWLPTGTSMNKTSSSITIVRIYGD